MSVESSKDSSRGAAFPIVLLAAIATLILATVAGAVDLRFQPSILGQVRRSPWSSQTETPTEIYGDLGLSSLPLGSTFDTYFRLEEDFSDLSSETDFFTGVLRVPALPQRLELQLGRQIVAESPVGLWDADSGQVRLAIPNSPLSLTVFGGAPRYWEPTIGPPDYSENEQIFGGSLRLAKFRGGSMSMGFLQQVRAGRELMQQVTLSGTRSFANLPGLPNFYGNFAFDADHQNVDQARAGFQGFVWSPRLLANFESGYYKPQDMGSHVVANLDRREDPIFQLFSVSDLLQFRGGTRYTVTPTVSTYADLSYQRYQQTPSWRDNRYAPTGLANGYVWSAGALWLPGGDGLEMVRGEYYGIDGVGGSVNGGRVTYENRVYENIVFRANLDVGWYEKSTNQDGVGIASLIGLGYMFLPGLVGEVDFEANSNQFMPQDFRFGFILTYAADYAIERGGSQRTGTGNEGRPWPWAPTQFGPASWGAQPAAWSANPGLPSGGGWAPSSFATADAAREAARKKDADAARNTAETAHPAATTKTVAK